MRLAIFSDTHGNYPLALRALEDAGQLAGVIHLGDEIEDAGIIEDIVGCPVVKVAGNCDRGTAIPRELNCLFAGVRFYLTHGDAFGVKGGLARLRAKAAAEDAQVVLYGHTHLAAVDRFDGILFVNPGTLHQGSDLKSFATIDIDAGTISARIVRLSPVGT